ncbi:uncharacterized protein LOC144762436 [Lissotriton helveticus]
MASPPAESPPRGKAATSQTPVEHSGQERSSAGSSAGPSVTTSDTALATTSAGASSAEGSTQATDAAAPPRGAEGYGSAAADGDAPKKLTRREMAVRARARKLEAIRVE